MNWTRRSVAMLAVLGVALVGTSGIAAARQASRHHQGGGGTLIIGAEQEGDCADWIASCSGASWAFWSINVNTIPRVFDPVKKNGVWTWKRNSVLKSEPKLVTSPKQQVTYEFSDNAVWNDGVPITSSDIKYTWDQIANGTDIYDPTGYKNIESVDDSNPKVAVVTFATPFASWKQLFAGQYGFLPSHLLEGKDRDAVMKDGYTFSAGPWQLESWAKTDSVTLVPNEKFWGKKPKLDKIIFKLITDTSAEFQSYKGGEVSMIYPQPQPDVVDSIKKGGLAGNKKYSADTGNAEALWINNAKAPFDDQDVRLAFSYAIDRAALVNRLFGPLGVKQPLNTFNPPIVARYADTKAFAQYKLDLKMVDKYMKKAGYKKDGGTWAKDGTPVELSMKTTVGNSRRKLSLEVIQSQLKKAGFKANIQYIAASDLFGQQLPEGDFDVALYAQVATSPEPGLCAVFCSENIPGPANENSGQNWTRTNVAGADEPLTQVDINLNDKQRISNGKKADKLLGKSATSLPLDPLPNILLWSKNIKGPVGDNPILGPFWNANEWSLK